MATKTLHSLSSSYAEKGAGMTRARVRKLRWDLTVGTWDRWYITMKEEV